jgi:hypothetical protein
MQKEASYFENVENIIVACFALDIMNALLYLSNVSITYSCGFTLRKEKNYQMCEKRIQKLQKVCEWHILAFLNAKKSKLFCRQFN